MGLESGRTVLEHPPVEEKTPPVELPQRVLGKTGEQVPILGLGSAPGGMGLKDDAAIQLYHTALDLGVTYLDTAPGYARAQVQLGEVIKDRRDEAFLVTKTVANGGKKALEILEQSLKDLQTDQVDLTYVHSLGGLDVDQVLAPDGSLAALREAQKRGWTRFVGFTAHNMPEKSVRLLQEAEVDVVMFAMNYADRHTYNFEGKALSLAVAQNAGVAAMKVYGGGRGMTYEKLVPSAFADQGVEDHGNGRHYSGAPVVADHEEQDQRQSYDARREALLQ